MVNYRVQRRIRVAQQKLVECNKAYKQSKEISAEMKHIMWKSRSNETFESSWIDFFSCLNLHDNNWLVERDKWVLVFLNNNFWVGMCSIQRSENIHTSIKGYLTLKSNLQQFVMQYDNCLASKAQKEYELDAVTFNTIIPYATASSIEKQF
ncbi:hypothetical protein Ahy_B05g078580 [Arachis hypogaea]|uniref:Protein FAR1-RELATED SEQUENCE n=1 Tax=Arachis hypogaea TaxID=3818 RepID=A0A444Z7G6_ARAHY|nr:hypothetical protein Ahy_B05g078580 [Arachis hypogaea]